MNGISIFALIGRKKSIIIHPEYRNMVMLSPSLYCQPMGEESLSLVLFSVRQGKG
jgi:hypothetical protein